MPSEARSNYQLRTTFPLAGAIPLAAIALFQALEPAQAQSVGGSIPVPPPIVPDNNSTNTIVTPDGSTFNITGGQTSQDGANLFHSFSDFNLSEGQIANFQSNPAIFNILGRITGGTPSIINGLIQVTGGNSNLFLMNPSGIVFGPNASLNVPGDFFATTANGIGFGNLWFNASGGNDYTTLVGTPSAWTFASEQPSAIINMGNLGVEQGQNLTLLGGTVISSGSLIAPGGQITVTSVPGQSVVRLTQPGNLLSLEVSLDSKNPSSRTNNRQLTADKIPEILTGGTGGNATWVTANNDGTFELTGSGIRVENGDVAVTEAIAEGETVTLSAVRNLTLVESQLATTGNLNLLALGKVFLQDTLANPLVANAGGDLRIQGDRSIDIRALDRSETLFQSGGDTILVSDGLISLDAQFASSGNFSIRNRQGEAANFVSSSEPIVTADGNVVFGNYTGPTLKVEATGSIQVGDIALSESEISQDGDRSEISNSSQPALILQAGVSDLKNPPPVSTTRSEQEPTSEPETRATLPQNRHRALPEELLQTPQNPAPTSGPETSAVEDTSPRGASLPASLVVGNISINYTGVAFTGSASGNILTGSITSKGGNVSLISTGGAINTCGTGIPACGTVNASATQGAGGSISLDAYSSIIPGSLVTNDNNISLNGRVTLAGNVSFSIIQGAGNITLNNTINGGQQLNLDAGTGDVLLRGAVGDRAPLRSLAIDADNVKINSTVAIATEGLNINANGTVTLEDSVTTDGSPVNISAGEEVNTGNINTNGGEIAIASNSANIFTSELDASSEIGEGGDVSVTADRGITSTIIDSHSPINAGGDVTLIANTNDIQVDSINTQGGTAGGDIKVETAGSFRALDSFTDQNGVSVSISTAGDPGGAIAIRHGGTPFEVGDANKDGTIPNGTVAAIATGTGETISAVQVLSQNIIQLSSSPPAKPDPGEAENLTPESEDTTPKPDSGLPTLNPDRSSTPEKPLENQPATPPENPSVSEKPPTPEADSPSPTIAAPQETPAPEADSPSPAIAPPQETPAPEADSPPPAIAAPQTSTAPEANAIASAASAAPQTSNIAEPSPEPAPAAEASSSANIPSSAATPSSSNSSVPPDVTRSANIGVVPDVTPPENITFTPEVTPATETDVTPEVTPPVNISVAPEVTSPANINVTPEVSIVPEVQIVSEVNVTPNATATPNATVTPPAPSSPNAPLNLEVRVNNNVPVTLSNSEPLNIEQKIASQLDLQETNNLDLPQIEQLRTREFADSLGVNLSKESLTEASIREYLDAIARQTNIRPAVVYAIALPDRLELIVIAPQGQSIHKSIPQANRQVLSAKVQELISELTNPRKINTDSYMSSSHQLYQWLIAPIAAELQAQGIDTLMFSLDAGLRSLPLAALHDGHQFLVEKYRLGLIPSITLTDASYQNLNNSSVLAMGASEFKDPNISKLPAVPLELSVIVNARRPGVSGQPKGTANQERTTDNGQLTMGLWPGQAFLNEAFTPDNFKAQRNQHPFSIVHLATHVQFQPGGDRSNSYIQFWDTKLPLDELGKLGLNDRPVELLVLSGCDTAFGNEETELGFAGLAVQMGVKSVLASMWAVDDRGTLALMSEFYRQLSNQETTIKAEALRQAQIAMLRGQVRFDDSKSIGDRGTVALPSDLPPKLEDRSLSHPYFWASFTLIGSPW